MDPLYLSVLVSAEKKFRRCVQSDNPRSRLALGRLHGLAAAVGGHEPTPEAPIAHFIELESAALPPMILRGAKRRVISRMTWAKIAPRCSGWPARAALAVRVLATSEATHSRPIRGRGRFGQYGG
jgi:hypothetical protein